MRRGYVLALAVVMASQRVEAKQKIETEIGVASWYGSKLNGHVTASGEVLDRQRLTAAHRTLPFGTVLEVTNRKNGRKVLVRVNDRGPLRRSRIIDLSPAAAAVLGFRKRGLAIVEVRPAQFE
jgi:peptidoglycan lytic transglycosylase